MLVVFPKKLAAIFETELSSPFLITGIALLFFSFTIVLEIYKQRPMPIRWIIIQDVLWVIASAYMLLFKPLLISDIGYSIIAIIALFVLAFAIFQSIGLAKRNN